VEKFHMSIKPGEHPGTTIPLSEAVARASQNQEAEWCDSPGAKFRYGLGRTYLYQLAADKLITSVSIRKPGQLRGKRLWNCESIRRFLNSQIKAAK
jgi:hypothetical protein